MVGNFAETFFFWWLSEQTLLNEMIEEETNLKEKIEHDIEVQKNELNVLRLELGLDSYQVSDGKSKGGCVGISLKKWGQSDIHGL